MTTRLLTIALLLLITACSNIPLSQKTLVLNYQDFGPQAMAYETLGWQWWQWQSPAEQMSLEANIKVVVYRDISLKKVEANYPVIAEKNQDYRYINYTAAMDYLNTHIQDMQQNAAGGTLDSLTEQLIQTKETLILHFNSTP